MSSIIIVGNGSSLLDNCNGNLIDTYHTVVRFNAFTIRNYEKYVGIKTDYWFNTINFPNISKQERLKTIYKKIYLHSWEWDIDKDPLYKTFFEYFNNINNNTPLIKTNVKTIKELQEYTNDYTYAGYSTGMIAIWLMLKEFEYVTITGFDWWNRNIHHYNDKAPRGIMHLPIKEFECINKLISESKVIML